MTITQTFNTIMATRRDQRNGATQVTEQNKEIKPMNDFITKLTAYRKEMVDDLTNLKAHDDTNEIEKKVELYREELKCEYAASKAQKVAKFESDIQCLDILIQREQTNSEV